MAVELSRAQKQSISNPHNLAIVLELIMHLSHFSSDAKSNANCFGSLSPTSHIYP